MSLVDWIVAGGIVVGGLLALAAAVWRAAFLKGFTEGMRDERSYWMLTGLRRKGEP